MRCAFRKIHVLVHVLENKQQNIVYRFNDTRY